MRIAVFLAAALILQQGNGCDQSKPAAVPKPQPYQRFIPMPRQPENLGGIPWSGAFALDTKTGQLCWTYDIVNHTDHDAWPSIPYCFDLFKQFPD